MKRTILLTTAAIMAASLAAPAFALDVGAGANVGGSVGANVGGNSDSVCSGGSGSSGGINVGGNANAGAQVGTDSGTTASTNSDANLALVISAIGSGDDNATAIQGMTDVSSVTVIDAGDLAQGDDEQALENAMSENEDGISGLRAAIDANADLKAEIVRQSPDSTDVVAVDVGADGALTVFVE